MYTYGRRMGVTFAMRLRHVVGELLSLSFSGQNAIMERFRLERKLGQGGFGEAFLVKSRASGVSYVMKKLRLVSVTCPWKNKRPY